MIKAKYKKTAAPKKAKAPAKGKPSKGMGVIDYIVEVLTRAARASPCWT